MCCMGSTIYLKSNSEKYVAEKESKINSSLIFYCEFYDFNKVTEVIGIDPAVSSVAIAKSRASNFHSKIT